MDQQKKKLLNNYAKYSSIGFQMVVIIAAGAFGGYKLDEYMELNFPVFALILTTLAVVLAIYFSIKDFIKPKKK